nr:50S ribosomal protein L5P [uncultured archaeon]
MNAVTTTMNKNREILLEKVTLNIGAGTETADVDKAIALLNTISGMKAVQAKARRRIANFKIRPGLPIGSVVTLRGTKAREILQRLLRAVENKIKEESFTQNGFSFGIKEYIDIPEVKYDPKIGIIGLHVNVALARCGYRVKRRKIRNAKIGSKHEISAKESAEWAQKELGISFKVEEEQQW